MLCYLPKNSDGTEISVTAADLNDGNAMTMSGQTVSADGDNIITMLTTKDTLLAVTAEVYGDSAIIHAETNKTSGNLCCHYAPTILIFDELLLTSTVSLYSLPSIVKTKV